MSRLPELLRSIGGDGRTWCEVATVTALVPHPAWGLTVEATLQPQGIDIEARPLWLNGGLPGEGVFVPIAVGDEVLVLLPGGDLNRAVAIAGPVSGGAPSPSGWLGTDTVLVGATGTRVLLTPAGVAQPLMTQTAATAIDAFAAACEVLGAALASAGAGAEPAAAAAGTALQAAATSLRAALVGGLTLALKAE